MSKRSLPYPYRSSRAAILANCRVILAIAAALVLAFAAVYHISSAEHVDPMWLRLSFAGLCIGALSSTYTSRWIRRYCVAVSSAVLYLITGWFLVLSLLNHFDAEYTLGLVFTMAAAGYAMIVTHPGATTVQAYAAVSTAAVALFLRLDDTPAINVWLVFGTVAGIGIVVSFAARMRMRLTADLVAGEKRFRKLSEAAFEAIFILESDRIVDCNANALALIGCSDPEAVLGSYFQQFMPDDQHHVALEILDRDEAYRSESSLVRSNGTMVPVEIRGRGASHDGRRVRVVVVRDITEQKRHEAELIAARKNAEAALETKNAILSNVSHEFRTPLAIMLGYAEMLKSGAFDDAAEMGDLIFDSGRRLNETLNLILEFAQIESGNLTLDLEEVDIAKLVREIVDRYRNRAESKGIRLHFDAPEHACKATVDPLRALKIMDYLLDNAVKFTNQGGIDVAVSSADGQILISVTDTGIGIREDYLPNVFDPFSQESSGLKRSHGGLGVGLPVARHMAELMGGSIKAYSGKGSGSRFVVSLPSSVFVADDTDTADGRALPV